MNKIMTRLVTTILALTIASTPINALARSETTTTKPLEEKEDPMLIGKRDINKHQIDFFSLNKEIEMGRQLAAETDKQMLLVDDPIVTEFINRVGQNIVLHSDAQIPFIIKVVQSDEINAFALPGGFFYVNTGLILAADNESELAGVMAHEIAHVTARHAVENLSKGQLLQLASIPLIFVGGGILGQLVQLGANFGLPLTMMKFSRGAEKEADILGAQYSWASGYDPNSLLTFFEKLQAKQKKEPGAFSKLFLTHPSTPDRIKAVKELLTRFPERDEYTVSSSEFNQVKGRLARLVGTSASTNRIGPDGKSTNDDRPTLKRKHPEGDTQESKEPSESKDAPVLKRKN